MGLDATRKLPGEGYHRGWPELARMDEATRQLVDELQKKAG
jgi:4-hydroxy-3-polyprenylbenzoate decarboxylase